VKKLTPRERFAAQSASRRAGLRLSWRIILMKRAIERRTFVSACTAG
jgi:hypothetical protein